MFKGAKQFNVNVQSSGEFQLFDGSPIPQDQILEDPRRKVEAYSSSVDEPQLSMETEGKALTKIREWAEEYFKKTKITLDSIPMNKVKEQTSRDFDIHAKVTDLETLNDQFVQGTLRDRSGISFYIKLKKTA